jgi:hypothetical protein
VPGVLYISFAWGTPRIRGSGVPGTFPETAFNTPFVRKSYIFCMGTLLNAGTPETNRKVSREVCPASFRGN